MLCDSQHHDLIKKTNLLVFEYPSVLSRFCLVHVSVYQQRALKKPLFTWTLSGTVELEIKHMTKSIASASGLSHLGLAFVLMLRPFSLELVIFEFWTSLGTSILLTLIYNLRPVGMVNFTLPFTTSATISISISQTFCSWEVILNLCQHITFSFQNL